MDLKFIPSIRSKTLKYNIMDNLLTSINFNDSVYQDTNEIFLYIDLHYIINSLLRDSIIKTINNDYLDNNPYEIFEGIIGFIGHYRNYFNTRHNMSTSIILYYSEDICKYKSNISNDYYELYYNKLFNNHNIENMSLIKNIKQNIKLVKAFTDFLPNTSVIDTTGIIDLHAVPNILIKPNTINLVITNLVSQYSLINTKDTDTIILSPAFGDKSFILSKHNFLNTIAKKFKFDLDEDKQWELLKPHMLDYVIMMTGEKRLSAVSGLTRVGMITALKRIYNLYIDNLLVSEYINPETLIECLQLDEDKANRVRATSRTLNNRIFVSEFLTDDILYLIEKQISSLSSLGQLEKVNSTKFDNRLNLEFLMAGEDW